MSGSMMLSSKFPPWPARAMVASLPMTWAATIMALSAMTGLTLPGMMEEPGWTSGSAISARLARGPAPSQRMSLAIFMRLTATVFRAPLAKTVPSIALWAWKWFSVSRTSTPKRSPSFWHTLWRELGVGVDAGADGRAAQGHLGEVLAGLLYALDAALDLARVAEELLAQPDRGGVLEVRPAGLDDVVELAGTSPPERRLQLLQRGQQVFSGWR